MKLNLKYSHKQDNWQVNKEGSKIIMSAKNIKISGNIEARNRKRKTLFGLITWYTFLEIVCNEVDHIDDVIIIR